MTIVKNIEMEWLCVHKVDGVGYTPCTLIRISDIRYVKENVSHSTGVNSIITMYNGDKINVIETLPVIIQQLSGGNNNE